MGENGSRVQDRNRKEKRLTSTFSGMDKLVIEALQKSGVNPLSEAYAIQYALDSGATQMEIAEVLGVNQAQVSRRLCVLDLIPELQGRVKNGRLNSNTAWKLSKMSPLVQKEIADKFSETEKKAIEILRRSTAVREVACPKCNHKFSVIP